jgi:hypothetical protein
MLGGDFELAQMHEVMQAFDDDLAQYYQQHAGAVDTVGFILSSFVPGMGGIKGLRALQSAGTTALESAMKSGRVGTTTGKALGLLAPNRERHVKDAINQLTSTAGATFSLQNKSYLRAVGAGAGQNILEAVAFETAVAATMFNSPVLENQDLGDLTYNIATGAILFGGIGGAIDATRSAFKIRGAVKDANKEAMPWTHYEEISTAASPDERIALLWDQARAIPPIPKEGMSPERIQFLETAANKKKEILLQEARREVGTLAEKDQRAAEEWFTLLQLQTNNNAIESTLGLRGISKVTETTKHEKTVEAAKKRIRAGKAQLNDKQDDVATVTNAKLAYVKTYGEGMGDMTNVQPSPVTIADKLTKNQEIVVSPSGVAVRDRTTHINANSWKFDVKDIKPWSPVASTLEEANARYLWAQSLPPLKTFFQKKVKGGTEQEAILVNAEDIPLLERAYLEWDNTVPMKVKYPDSITTAITQPEQLLSVIKAAKDVSANKLLKSSTAGKKFKSAEDAEQALRRITGINFQIDSTEGIFKRFQATALGVAEPDTGSIIVNSDYLTQLPIHRLIQVAKHEEGHQIFETIAQGQLHNLSGLDSATISKLRAELVVASKKARPELWKEAITDEQRFKYLNLDHELMADAFARFSTRVDKMIEEAPTFSQHFGHVLRPIPEEQLNKLLIRANELTQEEIAVMTNTRNSYLSGQVSAQMERDLFAMQTIAEEHTDRMIAAGLHKVEDGIIPTWRKPSYVKVSYDTTPVADLDGNIVRGMALIKEKQRLYTNATDTAVASALGRDAELLLPVTDLDIQKANSLGSGPGFATAASGNYGSLASTMEYLGNVTTGIVERRQEAVRDTLEPLLYQLTQNQKAAIEWSTLSANLRSYAGEHYVLTEAGDALIPKSFKTYQEKLAAGKNVSRPSLKDPSHPERIELQNQEVRTLAAAHIRTNGARIEGIRTLRTAQGLEYRTNSDVFYPPPVNPKDFKHFAIVTDNSVTGTMQKRMIHAHSPEELARMIAKIEKEPGFTVRTKGEIESHFKAIDEFEYESTLGDNWIDTALARKGVSTPQFIPTDPAKIANDLLSWHSGAEASFVRGAVRVKYEKQFSELHAMGRGYTNVATSNYGNSSTLKHADEIVENPYVGYERTALGLRNHQDYPWWSTTNRITDSIFSHMYERVSSMFHAAKTPEEIADINTALRQYGYRGPAYDLEMEALANHPAPRGVLSNFVGTANGVLAAVVLRLDHLNAVTNAVSSNVLLGTETKAVLAAIQRGDENAVGKLADIAKITVPGTGDKILAPQKLIANAMRDFASSDKSLHQFFKEHRFQTTISEQYRSTLDHLTLDGTESVAALDSKLHRAIEKARELTDTGERWTGNKLAEEFNRFVSAHVMKQITDIGVDAGTISRGEQLAYINTFVNRTQGNYLAAQRPMMFQGPIGQAIGLFQTYQFNLMQQLLRHVGEGSGKDAATLLALQGSIYGLNGLPGFQAINTHIVGSASGNTSHRDFYDVTYGIAGKEAGDWLMYGLASNMLLHPDLKVNLYSRGDINPRHLTLVPVDPASVPIVQASAKFFANVKRTADRLGQGGDPWSVILQGIEHNGISRPLAGLAQTLEAFANDEGQVYSTTKRGNVIASHDLLSLASIGRIVGGKPLDEAVAIDASFRYRTYALQDLERRNDLGQAIKASVIAGRTPTKEDIETFAANYTAQGGSQTEFNQWMMQLIRTANTSQANSLAQNLNSPFSQSMQRVMGGYELRDFAQ